MVERVTTDLKPGVRPSTAMAHGGNSQEGDEQGGFRRQGKRAEAEGLGRQRWPLIERANSDDGKDNKDLQTAQRECLVGRSASQPVSQSVCMPCCSPVNRTHARTHARTQHVFCCMQLQQTCSRTNSVDLISSDPYSASYFFSFPSSLYGVHFNPIHRPGFSMCRPADTFRRSPGFSN